MIHTEFASLTFKCKNHKCDNEFHAHIVEHKGGINDYGWWIVQCEKCSEIFDVYIGRDVNDSELQSGGQILDRFDKEVYSETEVKEAVNNLKTK